MSVKIFNGIKEPLSKIFGHEDISGLERFSFLEREHIKGKLLDIVTHIITDDYIHREGCHYIQSHKHEVDEINIIISPNSCLTYEMEGDGKVENVCSPSLIYIPAGTDHRAEGVSGTGIFICIHLD